MYASEGDIDIDGIVDRARDYVIKNDRRMFLPILREIEQFAIERAMIFGGRTGVRALCIRNKRDDPPADSARPVAFADETEVASDLWTLELFSSNIEVDMEDCVVRLTARFGRAAGSEDGATAPTRDPEKIYRGDWRTIFLRTIIPGQEYRLSADYRIVAIGYSLGERKGIDIASLIAPIAHRGPFGAARALLMPHDMLIENLAHQLSNPLRAGNWSDYVAQICELFNARVTIGGADDASGSDSDEEQDMTGGRRGHRHHHRKDRERADREQPRADDRARDYQRDREQQQQPREQPRDREQLSRDHQRNRGQQPSRDHQRDREREQPSRARDSGGDFDFRECLLIGEHAAEFYVNPSRNLGRRVRAQYICAFDDLDEYARSLRLATNRADVRVPNDFRLRKSILKDARGELIADLFNALAFEPVPYVVAPPAVLARWRGGVPGEHPLRRTERVAAPFVVLRFLFVDIWALEYVAKSSRDGAIATAMRAQQEHLRDVAHALFDWIANARAINTLFPRTYAGIFALEDAQKRQVKAKMEIASRAPARKGLMSAVAKKDLIALGNEITSRVEAI